eukprot:GFUD01015952.1.p1 GENE.GFUD01015952.1~~GFUD01015952.1.p1  ORF type:complete len:524 (+),score=122.63 GFUD01015952.1:177-1748(+)
MVDRIRIEEQCRKRFQLGKKVYTVPIHKYHTHTKLKEEINTLTTEFSEIAVQYNIGKSVSGRDLICLKITEDATKDRQMLKPQVKYISNIHGDEVVGRELLIALARALCEQYGQDSAITNLLQTVEIHLLPSMNPDGYVLKTRNNANDKDLNRGFPDWGHLGTEHSLRLDDREPEVAAVMNWISSNNFLLSLSFHDGWTMIIFPWDDSPGCTTTDNAVCSEDNAFYTLAQTYSCNHKFMHTGHCPCHSEALPIGNYREEELEVVEGGMQDYNYMFSNCMELTVEVSCDKKPAGKTLTYHWENNYQSMLSVLQSADGGVKGLVVDEVGVPLAGAKVRISGVDKEIVATERGEYWRLLVPGTYVITARSESQYGLLESEPTTVIISHNMGDGAIVIHLVARMKLPGRFLVSGYQAGDKKAVQLEGENVVRDIFIGYEIVLTDLVKNEARVQATMNICYIVFTVEVVLNSKAVVAYFKERWGDERIMRPACSIDQKKLHRRLNSFLEETFCEDKLLSSRWTVRVED